MNKQGTVSRAESAGRYAAVRNSINTFDIINCEHKDLFWRLIGHTATVYVDPLTGMVFVYESTSLNKWSGISGVQLTPMRIWLDRYPGKAKLRKAYHNGEPLIHGIAVKWGERNEYFVQPQTAHQHIKKYRGVPYPDMSDPRQAKFLINSAIDLPLGIGLNPDRHDIMFCTQLVVDYWQYASLYIGDEPPSEFEPDDMRPGGKFEKQLADGITLGKEIDLNEEEKKILSSS